MIIFSKMYKFFFTIIFSLFFSSCNFSKKTFEEKKVKEEIAIPSINIQNLLENLLIADSK